MQQIISLFSGAGGMDLGFKKANFQVIWANEFDKKIWETYRCNHPDTYLDTRSIRDIPLTDIPDDIVGIIGGPPCQSWSLAGEMRGINDERGQLFFEYLRILKGKKPVFFVLENVPGILSKTHKNTFINIIHLFEECGYEITYELLNAHDYNVPQLRQRVIVVGYRKDLKKTFNFNLIAKSLYKPVLKDAIADLPEPLAALSKNYANPNVAIPNHEYMTGDYSSIYLSRNRKKNWDEPSFTIQASGRHTPLHPASNPMIKVDKDRWIFDTNTIYPYRRLSVRECARIQTFPDDFIFIYNKINDGYKMVGNAVPVNLAYTIGKAIFDDLSS
jgi:DNA (cytosine-5)-methyltransferase 1